MLLGTLTHPQPSQQASEENQARQQCENLQQHIELREQHGASKNRGRACDQPPNHARILRAGGL